MAHLNFPGLAETPQMRYLETRQQCGTTPVCPHFQNRQSIVIAQGVCMHRFTTIEMHVYRIHEHTHVCIYIDIQSTHSYRCERCSRVGLWLTSSCFSFVLIHVVLSLV